MPIARGAIKAFKERKLRNSQKAKLFTPEAIEAKIKKLDPAPMFPTPNRHHQSVGFLLGVKYENYMFLYDMGLGKSKLVLDIVAYRKKRDGLRRTLVLVPGTQHVGNWEDQVKEHQPGLSVDAVLGEKAQREAALESDGDVCIATYMGFVSLTCVRGGGHMHIDEVKFKQVAQQFDCVVYDEIQHFKNPSPKTLFSKIAKRLLKYVPIRYGLTGTPMNKDPSDFWAEFYAIDGGVTLGTTLGLYRAAYFKTERNWYTKWDEYVFDKRNTDAVHRILGHSSIRYAKQECLDLPSKNYVKEHAILSSDTWKYYERLVDDLKEADGNFRMLDNVFLRMRQLSSGYITFKDEEEGKHEITFQTNPKLDLLIELMKDAIDDGCKMLVYCDYIRSLEMVCERLKKEKIKYQPLSSGVKQKDQKLKKFLNDPKQSALVMTSAGASGLNLQVANYLFFYETPVAPITRQQAEDRIYRIGQEKKVFIYDLVCKGTIDENTLKSLKEGKDLQKQLVDGTFLDMLVGFQ